MLQETPPLQNILILGGSTFMGKELLAMLSQMNQFQVYYVNRGKKYWDNDVKQYTNAIYTYGNRDETVDYQKLLVYVTKKYKITKWDAIIDFCAFKAKHVKAISQVLQTNIYFLISTDSIYDVCDRSKRKNNQPIEEDQDIRCSDDELYQIYKKDEEYGHDKLKCEEYLKQFVNRSNFPYIVLRLPDVIGPFDDTSRFWALIKWIQQMKLYPLQLVLSQ